MATIKKEKDKTWTVRYDFYQGGKRHQSTKRGFKLKADAEIFASKMVTMKSKNALKKSSDTLVEYVNKWLAIQEAKVKANDITHSTYRYYKRQFDTIFEDYWGDVKHIKVTAKDIEAYHLYRTTLPDKYGKLPSKNTIKKRYETMRTIFIYAYKHGDIYTNPFDVTTAPQAEKVHTDIWTPEDIKRALKLFVDTPIEFHVITALLTLMRIGEICAIHEDFINFDTFEYDVREQVQIIEREICFTKPKTYASQDMLPLNNDVVSLFEKRILAIKENRMRYANVYKNDYNGRLSVNELGRFLRPSYVSEMFHEILINQNEVPVIRFHDLRHSGAVWHVAKKTDMKTLQALLRHGDFKMTYDRYADTTMKLKRDAVNNISLADL